MSFITKMDRRAVRLWSLLLVLSLLCLQDRELHVHSFGHDEHLDHSHISEETGDHDHLSKTHPANDLAHSEHHDNILYQVDINSEVVLKNISNTLHVLAIFILSFGLIQAGFVWPVIYSYTQSKLIRYKPYLFSPPLRAPPLH